MSKYKGLRDQKGWLEQNRESYQKGWLNHKASCKHMSLKNCLTKSNGDNTVDSVTKEDGGVNTMDNVTTKVVVKPEARCDHKG